MDDTADDDFDALRWEYEKMFGETITRGFGMPEDDSACCDIIRMCLERGEPVDLHRDLGHPEGVIY